jgi:hypothetical protein
MCYVQCMKSTCVIYGVDNCKKTAYEIAESGNFHICTKHVLKAENMR